jgi:hypothetical protein
MDPEIHPPRDPADKGWFRSRSGVVFLGFAAVGGFILLTEHRSHVFQVLPWLLLAACPLMHFFHHGHHR